jgi:hypothetical protein
MKTKEAMLSIIGMAAASMTLTNPMAGVDLPNIIPTTERTNVYPKTPLTKQQRKNRAKNKLQRKSRQRNRNK